METARTTAGRNVGEIVTSGARPAAPPSKRLATAAAVEHAQGPRRRAASAQAPGVGGRRPRRGSPGTRPGTTTRAGPPRRPRRGSPRPPPSNTSRDRDARPAATSASSPGTRPRDRDAGPLPLKRRGPGPGTAALEEARRNTPRDRDAGPLPLKRRGRARNRQRFRADSLGQVAPGGALQARARVNIGAGLRNSPLSEAGPGPAGAEAGRPGTKSTTAGRGGFLEGPRPARQPHRTRRATIQHRTCKDTRSVRPPLPAGRCRRSNGWVRARPGRAGAGRPARPRRATIHHRICTDAGRRRRNGEARIQSRATYRICTDAGRGSGRPPRGRRRRNGWSAGGSCSTPRLRPR